MSNCTLGEQVSDVQLQRRNNFVKHLEFLPKARHLEDEAGRHLQLEDRQNALKGCDSRNLSNRATYWTIKGSEQLKLTNKQLID